MSKLSTVRRIESSSSTSARTGAPLALAQTTAASALSAPATADFAPLSLPSAKVTREPAAAAMCPRPARPRQSLRPPRSAAATPRAQPRRFQQASSCTNASFPVRNGAPEVTAPRLCAISPISIRPSPRPPYCSGTESAVQPCSTAVLHSRSSYWPVTSTRSSRRCRSYWSSSTRRDSLAIDSCASS